MVLCFFGLPLLLDVEGIWLAVPAAEGLGVLVSVGFLLWGRRVYQYGASRSEKT